MKLKILSSLLALAPSALVWASPVLIHQYDFSGSTVTDSVGTENGTLLGGATVSGGKLVLDGSDDYVEFATHLIPTSGSFSVRFDAQGFPVNNDLYTEMISQGGGPGFYIGYDLSSSHKIRLGDNFGTTSISFPTDNLYHDYLLTSDALGTRFYIDGSLMFSSATPMGIAAGGTDTRLGRQYDGHAEYFPGNIDNLSIYTGSFAADEVHGPSVPDSGATISLLLVSGTALAMLRRKRR